MVQSGCIADDFGTKCREAKIADENFGFRVHLAETSGRRCGVNNKTEFERFR